MKNNRYFKGTRASKMCAESRGDAIANEITRIANANNTVRNLGPKLQILNAYKQYGKIEDALDKANEINSKLGRIVYPEKEVRKWIEEFKIKVQEEKGKDEEDAR